ncbi:KpsF/GutQ family sugar-phosphate isomerase [Teredinibacter waterburyi]|jgi:KpsF/GutQ family protein|uniref:KpsF/GutQ family sugar-phosphate isomerase n=1 Tax=Teredinibacter waterburyi TaxID=1500538 RepID=UPI00165EE185|nr:KpsF/GutQ family sugar-phosphate isomerase [Teredinibacter waterburyi]
MTNTFDFIQAGRRTVTMERDAVAQLEQRIGDQFEAACKLMLKSEGRVIVSGMGKSGHIAKKIAATLSSTGTPAIFVHPGEAGHGDLGMVTRNDVFIAISNSGSSPELLTLLPMIKRLGIPLITMSGKQRSPLQEAADVWLDISVASEACPLDLAPTSSTTVTLVLGDALAVALLEARGFTAEDFAFSHPGGAIGRKLLLRVSDVMHSGDAIPAVTPSTALLDALSEISRKGFGITGVTNDNGQLIGAFTDGDLRRCLDRDLDVKHTCIAEVMSARPRTASPNLLAAEAVNLMEKYKITALLVVDDDQRPVGILHMHDMLKAGLL